MQAEIEPQKSVFSRFGFRAGQVSRQKTPVVLTQA
jgi:hypothetical protein